MRIRENIIVSSVVVTNAMSGGVRSSPTSSWWQRASCTPVIRLSFEHHTGKCPSSAEEQEKQGESRDSDEAHFWLNGYVNKQNCRIWSEANPQVYVETPLHPEKLTVWCALWADGIIGPYFFKNDEGHNVTVNGDR
ncbi:uncharacterized protein TNCV_2697681 [Trichonephila clavipes]|nr:uncharacterized protein TNCV_2697681 [Trichonephila clavipes]